MTLVTELISLPLPVYLSFFASIFCFYVHWACNVKLFCCTFEVLFVFKNVISCFFIQLLLNKCKVLECQIKIVLMYFYSLSSSLVQVQHSTIIIIIIMVIIN